ncbi:MAG: AarF/UbiB family protein [Acidimicrobiales bacterium]|nr:AarF/UbiB family protein [Acidimicrobiales bacterium]
MRERTLAERARDSAWVSQEDGLAEQVAELEAAHGSRRLELGQNAAALARPGIVPPARLAQHVLAAGASRMLRTLTRFPGDLRSLVSGRNPQQLAMEAAVEAFADQLALSGPASAEVARIIEGSGSLFPGVLRNELQRRHIRPLDLDPQTVEWIARRALGEIVLVGDEPITAVPTSQLHAADLPGGRPANVRVRRPGVARELRADARFSGALATAMSRIAPDQAGLGMGPVGFVELVARCGIEATDLELEALNAIEIGLILEEAGVERLSVARPLPGHITERAMASERLLGVPLHHYGGDLTDPGGLVAALTSVTLEAALTHGTFWADPAPEHLLVLPGGRLAIVGLGTVGHFSPQLRRAGITFLRSVLSGEFEGQVEAMRIAGAAPADLDVGGLVAEMQAAEALEVSRVMFGGEEGLLGALNETVRIMLKYNLKPPVEVALLLRTVFALGQLAERIDPEGGGLMAALMGLLPRLPDLLADVSPDGESVDRRGEADTDEPS